MKVLSDIKAIVLVLIFDLGLISLLRTIYHVLLIWSYRVDINDVVGLVLFRSFDTNVLHFDLKLRATR